MIRERPASPDPKPSRTKRKSKRKSKPKKAAPKSEAKKTRKKAEPKPAPLPPLPFENAPAPEQNVMHTNSTLDLDLVLLQTAGLLQIISRNKGTITEYTHRLAHCETRVFAELDGMHDGERLLTLLACAVEASTAGALLAAYPHPLVPQHVIVTAAGMPVLVVITESGTETEVLCDRLRELFALFGPWSLRHSADARENEIMENDK